MIEREFGSESGTQPQEAIARSFIVTAIEEGDDVDAQALIQNGVPAQSLLEKTGELITELQQSSSLTPWLSPSIIAAKIAALFSPGHRKAIDMMQSQREVKNPKPRQLQLLLKLKRQLEKLV